MVNLLQHVSHFPPCASAGHVLGIIIGVCVVLAVLLTIAAVIVRRLCCKKDNVDNYTSKR